MEPSLGDSSPNTTASGRLARRDHARECVVRTGRTSSNLGRSPIRLRGRTHVRGWRAGPVRNHGLTTVVTLVVLDEKCRLLSWRDTLLVEHHQSDHGRETVVRTGSLQPRTSVRPLQRIGLTPEAGGRSSRPYHALTCVVTPGQPARSGGVRRGVFQERVPFPKSDTSNPKPRRRMWTIAATLMLYAMGQAPDQQALETPDPGDCAFHQLPTMVLWCNST